GRALVPIILFDGKILDGRTRYELCLELGLPFEVEHFTGTTKEALELVSAFNVCRRHLTQSEKGAVAALIAKRMIEGDGIPMAKELEAHPAAEAYPMMPSSELSFLVDDMRAHGFDKRFPIFLLGGRILDGRNRYKAALQAGVKPILVNLPKTTDPDEFVARAN